MSSTFYPSVRLKLREAPAAEENELRRGKRVRVPSRRFTPSQTAPSQTAHGKRDDAAAALKKSMARQIRANAKCIAHMYEMSQRLAKMAAPPPPPVKDRPRVQSGVKRCRRQPLPGVDFAARLAAAGEATEQYLADVRATKAAVSGVADGYSTAEDRFEAPALCGGWQTASDDADSAEALMRQFEEALAEDSDGY